MPALSWAISNDFWRPIVAREATAAKAAEEERLRWKQLEQEEYERERPKRERAARRAAARRTTSIVLKSVFGTPIGCVVGGLCGAVLGLALSLIVNLGISIFLPNRTSGFLYWATHDGPDFVIASWGSLVESSALWWRFRVHSTNSRTAR